jgi:hypothetical protein
MGSRWRPDRYQPPHRTRPQHASAQELGEDHQIDMQLDALQAARAGGASANGPTYEPGSCHG